MRIQINIYKNGATPISIIKLIVLINNNLHYNLAEILKIGFLLTKATFLMLRIKIFSI